MTVKEVSRLCGVSVRTLHYYDEIGLLRPGNLSEAGYRIYGEEELLRLQQILFFRELGFPLKQIRAIMQEPSFDTQDALQKQRELLALKRDRILGLLRLIDNTLKGEHTMSFHEFDESALETARKKYADEVKERWGNTAAYEQSEERAALYQKEDWARIEGEANKIFEKFAEHMDLPPSDPKVQALVGEWQQHITESYYECTDEILAGLGEMYTADERFKKNLDAHAKGLADFMAQAIKHYVTLM